MSELTPCNHCSLLSIKARAKAQRKIVTVLSDATWGLGGVNVYVHPKDVDIQGMEGGEEGSRSEFRVAWLMELPDHCCC